MVHAIWQVCTSGSNAKCVTSPWFSRIRVLPLVVSILPPSINSTSTFRALITPARSSDSASWTSWKTITQPPRTCFILSAVNRPNNRISLSHNTRATNELKLAKQHTTPLRLDSCLECFTPHDQQSGAHNHVCFLLRRAYTLIGAVEIQTTQIVISRRLSL